MGLQQQSINTIKVAGKNNIGSIHYSKLNIFCKNCRSALIFAYMTTLFTKKFMQYF
jgi:hypothetical protein